MNIQGTFDCPLAITICRSLEKLPGGIEQVDIIALPSCKRNGAEDEDWTLTQTTAPHVTMSRPGHTSSTVQGVAEVSRIGHYRRGELLCMDGRANPLMDRKVVGAVLFGVVAMVAVVTSLTTPGCSVV